MIDTRIELNTGVLMPIFGIGTHLIPHGFKTQEVVYHALQAGYRLVDTAQVYNNEADVGIAIQKSDLPRKDVFITTKIAPANHSYECTLKACEESLQLLKTSYIDLFLSHWPIKNKIQETWRAMELLLDEGKCRALGVSNYTKKHLIMLLAKASVIPAVNQIEFHPYLYQKDLLEFCRDVSIQVEAYSPLTKGIMLNDPLLLKLASKYNKTPAQLLLRWGLQHDIIVISRSSRKPRIYENAQVFDFELQKEDMKVLNSLNQNLHTGWDPSNA